MSVLEELNESQQVFKKIYKEFFHSLSDKQRSMFSQLKNDEDRVAFMSRIFPDIRSIIEDKNSGKDEKMALQLKEQGNLQFIRGDTYKALMSYSEAVVKMPIKLSSGRHELALLVANRSAALYHLNKYNEALSDIEYALEKKYPVELRYKIYDRKSRCLLALKKHNDAFEAFKKTLQSLDDSKLNVEKKLKMQKDIQIMLSLLAKENTKNGRINAFTTEVAQSKDKHKIEKKLTKPNLKFPALSDSVEIEHNKELGRFATAARDLAVGETVLIEKSHCSVLVAESTSNHCLGCFKRTIAPYSCEGCCMAVFCSDSCQKAANVYHRYECSYISTLYKCGMSVLVLMALRIITQTSLQYFQDIKPTLKNVRGEKPTKYRSNDYLTVYNLVRHEEERPADNYMERSAIAITLIRFLQDTGYFAKVADATDNQLSSDEIYIGGLILRNLQILQFNAHEISEFETEGTESLGQAQSKFIAGGLYPTLALFNHSCDPGIVRYNLGTNVVVKTVRPVAAGEEVSENYGPIFTVKKKTERREQLRTQYWFDCNCKPCLEDWPMLTEMDKLVIPFRCYGEEKCSSILRVPYNTQEFMIKCIKCGRHSNILKGLKALQDTDGMFRQALDNMKRGKIQAALDIYLNILSLLHQYLVPPFNDYHLCQQAIRKCMISMGNKYVIEI